MEQTKVLIDEDGKQYLFNKDRVFALKNQNFFDFKDLLKQKETKLVLAQEGRAIKTFDDCQVLHFYPLTILDYIKGLKNLNKKNFPIISLEVDSTQDYSTAFELLKNNKNIFDFKNLVKINLDKNSGENLSEFVKKTKQLGSLICFKTETINFDNNVDELFSWCDYLKITINDFSSSKQVERLKQLVNQFRQTSKGEIQIKIYINNKQQNLFVDFFDLLANLKVDHVIISKQLLPIGEQNQEVLPEIADEINFIKNQYKNNFYLKTVRDFSKIYYDRFMLDKRNHKVCYMYKFCPSITNGRFYPCQSTQVLTDEKYLYNQKNLVNSFNAEGQKGLEKTILSTCKDCANIFENDLLFEVETIIKEYGNINAYLQI